MKNKLKNVKGTFLNIAERHVDITNEEDYRESLDLLEILLESSQDSKDDPLNPLIDLLSMAIERYESSDEKLKTFTEEADDISKDIDPFEH